MIDDEYENTIVGTPQGGNIFPFLAKVLLNGLDKELEERGLGVILSLVPFYVIYSVISIGRNRGNSGFVLALVDDL